jgi:hypothetical protein
MEHGLTRLGGFSASSAHYYVRHMWTSALCLSGIGLLGIAEHAKQKGHEVPLLGDPWSFYLLMFFSVGGFLGTVLPVIEGKLRSGGKHRD